MSIGDEQFLDGESVSHQHSGTNEILREYTTFNDNFTKRLKDENRKTDEKEIGEKRPILESPPPIESKKEEVTKKGEFDGGKKLGYLLLGSGSSEFSAYVSVLFHKFSLQNIVDCIRLDRLVIEGNLLQAIYRSTMEEGIGQGLQMKGQDELYRERWDAPSCPLSTIPRSKEEHDALDELNNKFSERLEKIEDNCNKSDVNEESTQKEDKVNNNKKRVVTTQGRREDSDSE
ncbi:hypothetical protein C1646_752113 [Rhizophagus diaphanus]|nr:hypothetical protein C1646_752113 [Rhizophagus diaphanus] [Rhizophagus sp. MUCL 43196]